MKGHSATRIGRDLHGKKRDITIQKPNNQASSRIPKPLGPNVTIHLAQVGKHARPIALSNPPEPPMEKVGRDRRPGVQQLATRTKPSYMRPRPQATAPIATIATVINHLAKPSRRNDRTEANAPASRILHETANAVPISFQDILDANTLQITELVPLAIDKTGFYRGYIPAK